MSPHGSERAEPDTSIGRGERLRVVTLGRVAYAAAYQHQVRSLEATLARRERGDFPLGEILLVEHDPVITVSRKAQSGEHLLASSESLASMGVGIEQTDRGGDITYHGPGQAVVYPILDLDRLRMGLHAYLRLLEGAMIDVCADHGVACVRDPNATGVWTVRDGRPHAKIGAIGIRVRRWITMHGLALNVSTNLDHFGLIVPCGLVGRPVTSLKRVRGEPAPALAAVASQLAERIIDRVDGFVAGDPSSIE